MRNVNGVKAADTRRTQILARIAGPLLGLVAVALLPLLLTSRYSSNLLILTASWGITTLGLTVVLGFTGQLSMGQAMFYGIGAYAIGLGTTRWGMGWWPSLLLGLLAAGFVGIILGLTTLRVSGRYLAMVTICVQIIFTLVATNWISFTGGPDGVSGIPRPSLIASLGTSQNYAWFSLGVLWLVSVLVWILSDTPLGRAMKAVRDDELAAEALGVDTLRIKVTAFLLSAVLGSLGGALYASGFFYISPDSFAYDQSVQFLAAGLAGGIGSVPGALLGSWLLVFLPEWLRGLKNIYLVVYGCIIVFVIVFMPDGLWGYVKAFLARIFRPKPLGESRERLSFDQGGPGEVLCVKGLAKHFGGLKALDGADFTVSRGDVLALIGPNGSGKTTCINVISGVYRPTFGNVRFLEHDVTGMRSDRIACHGIRRTFQNLRMFRDMSVWENVLVGSQHGGGTEAEIRDRAIAAIDFVGLRDRAHKRAKSLPYGHQKLVELARALAGKPQLLLLDEPAAGLNQTEKQGLVDLLKRLHDEGLTMVLVEHDMSVVSQIATKATVLNFGQRIAAGTPKEVLEDPVVVEAYLGAKEVTANA